MRSLKLNFFASLFGELSFVATTTVDAEDKMKIIAIFSILCNMVEQVIGEHVSITTIVEPDADTSIYQTSITDAR